MRQPTDSSQIEAKPGCVWNIVKSLYRTRRAGEIWGSYLDKTLKQQGFQVSKFENKLYFLKQGNQVLTLAILVDDIAFSPNSSQLLEKFKRNLQGSSQ